MLYDGIQRDVYFDDDAGVVRYIASFDAEPYLDAVAEIRNNPELRAPTEWGFRPSFDVPTVMLESWIREWVAEGKLPPVPPFEMVTELARERVKQDYQKLMLRDDL